MVALAGRDALLDLFDPAPPLVLALDRASVEVRLQVNDAARDVVARAALDDGLIRDKHRTDRDTVSDVTVRHQVSTRDAFVARAVGDLLPALLFRRSKEVVREKRVDLDLHVAALRHDVVVFRSFRGRELERHGEIPSNSMSAH